MVESTTAQIRSRKNTEKSTGLSSDNWGRDTEEEEINTDELNEKVASFSQDILELSAIKAKKIPAFKQVSTHCTSLHCTAMYLELALLFAHAFNYVHLFWWGSRELRIS